MLNLSKKLSTPPPIPESRQTIYLPDHLLDRQKSNFNSFVLIKRNVSLVLRLQKLFYFYPNRQLKLGAAATSLVIGLSGCQILPGKVYYMPSASMEPTVLVNDRFWVNLNAYSTNTPQRGDIVIFRPTEALKRDGFNEIFLKRVIGLPGEQVSLVDGKVYINGKALSEPYLAAGTKTKADICNSISTAWLAKPQTIPAKQYFVLGDNRENSYDGRCWGLVPSENLVGQATTIFWPPEHYGSLKGK
jgi:signal peptidase I